MGTQRPPLLDATPSGSSHGGWGASPGRTSWGVDSRLPRPLPSHGSPKSRTRPRPECHRMRLPRGAAPRGILSALVGAGSPSPGTDRPRPSVSRQGLLLRLGGCLEAHRPGPTTYVPIQGLQPSSSASSTEERDSGSVSLPETLSFVLPWRSHQACNPGQAENGVTPCPVSRGLSCLSPCWFS